MVAFHGVPLLGEGMLDRIRLDGRLVERLVLAEWDQHEGQALCVSPQGLRREPIRAAGHPVSGLTT